jgi:hypothetical protein
VYVQEIVMSKLRSTVKIAVSYKVANAIIGLVVRIAILQCGNQLSLVPLIS